MSLLFQKQLFTLSIWHKPLVFYYPKSFFFFNWKYTRNLMIADRCVLLSCFHYKMKDYLFSTWNFSWGHWWFTGEMDEGGGHLSYCFITSTCSRTLKIICILCNWYDYLVAAITTNRMLLDEIHQPLVITIWVNVNSIPFLTCWLSNYIEKNQKILISHIWDLVLQIDIMSNP